MLRIAPLLFLLSSSAAAEVQLELLNFSYEQDGAATVEIGAEAPLLTLGEGSLTGLLHSEPAVAWSCYFWTEDQLSCRTVDGSRLPPATPVRLRIARHLLASQSGAPVAGLDAQLETPRAKLEWTDIGADARGLPQVLLYHGVALQTETLDGRVVVRQDDQEWPLTLRPVAAGAEQHWPERSAAQRWSFDWPQQLQPGLPVQLLARPGLRVVGGALATTETQKVLTWLPTAQFEFSLGCSNTDTDCYSDGTLQLRVNSVLTESTVQALLAALPEGMRLEPPAGEIRSNTSPTGPLLPQQVWSVQLDVPRKRFVLKIDPDWRGAFGQAPATNSLVFESGKLSPKWRIAPQTVLVPIGTVEPKQWLDWANQPELELLRMAVAGGVLPSSTLLPASDGSKREQLVIEPGLQKLRSHGGSEWGVLRTVSWAKAAQALPGADANAGAAEFARAWADVGLHALVTSDQVRLIATDLYSARPLNQVELELLGLPPEQNRSELLPLAEALSDADGQAVVAQQLPTAGFEPMQTLVRARRGPRLTVLPLSPIAQLPRNSADAYNYDAAVPYYAFSERILYRPGETVHFRVFHRKSLPRRLAAPPAGTPVELRIGSELGIEMARFTLALDEFGGANQSWRIPDSARDGYYYFNLAEPGKLSGRDELPGFRIASVDPAALEVSLALPEGAVSPDALPALKVSAGYYSGGPATGISVRIEGLLDATGDSALYAQLPGFEFESSPEAADDAKEKQRFEALGG